MKTFRPSTRAHRHVAALLGPVVVAALVTALPAAATASTTTAAPAVVVAPAAAVLGAAAVGKLQPSGCAHDAGAATDDCDLYAMAGTTQVLGQTLPIWGFSTTSDAGTATAPGPGIVVNEGDTVTVRLHNQLSQNVSLAFPGQPANGFSAGLDNATGADPSGSATYTFKADRPGTFLYEAGHTKDGARQVAMGLAGALVVLAKDGTAAGQAYDDESVVVLSEIDPRLNAAPATFDMRDFKARYRLINGRPFPSATSIPTDQGHKVLLRYVNVGTVTHPMSTLGATQLQVAEDGHSFKQPERELVTTLDAGTTADTVVTMPTGPETKVTLFESGSHLDNNGQTEQDPGKVAIGGMLAFLDTNAPPVTDDHVGPVPAHVSISPNPSDGKNDVTVTTDLSDVKSGGSTVTNGELMVDDPTLAPGAGLPLTGTFGGVAVTAATGTIPAVPAAGAPCDGTQVALSCLSAGKHIVYVRGLDAANNWGVVGSAVLNLPKTGPSTTAGSVDQPVTNGSADLAVSATGDDSNADGKITDAEMFIDTQGVDGSGLALSLNQSATVVSEDGSIPAAAPTGTATPCPAAVVALSCLTEGAHHALVHSKDSLGLWGPVLDIPFTVDRTGPSVDAAAVSPNPSNGLVSSPGNTGYLKVSALVTDRANGALQSKLTGVEGFFAPSSATPKPGTGFQFLAVDGKWDAESEQAYGLIPLSQVKVKADGSYQVYVRGRDQAGNWGDLFAMPLVVDKTAPALGTPVTATPNPTNGAALLTLAAPVTKDTSFQTAEFWTGTTDPGAGKATRVSVSYVNGSAVVSVPTAGLPAGSVRLNLRVQDMAGNWSNAVNTTVTVVPNAIFSDTFNSGNLNAWSTRTNAGTGAMAASALAGIPVGRGNLGLAVSGAGTHYLTDNTPAAETSYHARFKFAPTTNFTNGTAGAVTLFSGRNATADVATVDYRKNGSTNQVRVVMARSGTAGAVTGPWQNLASGSHELRIDWSSGSTGSLTLSVDGTAAPALTGDNHTLRVESARLGLVTAGAAGTAYIDSFESTRYTLP